MLQKQVQIDGRLRHVIHFTAREQQLLCLICAACPSKEIAYVMTIQPGTVRAMCWQLARELKVCGRLGLFKFCVQYPSAHRLGTVVLSAHAKGCVCPYCQLMHAPFPVPIPIAERLDSERPAA